ncbi:hypothetical protein Tco_0492216 [Tanacetum coccineum]
MLMIGFISSIRLFPCRHAILMKASFEQPQQVMECLVQELCASVSTDTNNLSLKIALNHREKVFENFWCSTLLETRKVSVTSKVVTSLSSYDDDQDDEQAQDDEDAGKNDVNETKQDDEDDDDHDNDEKGQDDDEHDVDETVQEDDDEEQTESDDDGDDFVHPKLTTHDDEIIHEEDKKRGIHKI